MNKDYFENDFFKSYLKSLKKERRTHRRKLPNYKWVTVVSVSCLFLLFLSFIMNNSALISSLIKEHTPIISKQTKEWFSNVLLSIGCGEITGLVLYFLTNIRNNKQISLFEEYSSIKKVCDALRCILHVLLEMSLNKQTIFDKKALLALLDDLEEKRGGIPLEVYDTVPSIGYDPLDHDNMNSYRDRINLSNSEENLTENLVCIMKEMQTALMELGDLEQEFADQIEIMRKSFF